MALLSSCLLIMDNAIAVTLNQELANLINSHPLVMANQYRVSAADAEINAVLDNYKPVLDISGDVGQQQYEDTGAGTDSDLNNNRFSVSVTQNVFKGYKDKAKENETISKQLTTQLTLDKTIQQLTYEGSTTYLDVLHYSYLSELIKEKVELSKQFIAMREKQKNSGAGNQVNVYEAQLTLHRSLEQQLNIEGRKRITLSKYQNLYEHEANSAEMLSPPPIQAFLPSSLAEATSIAKQSNLNISIAQTRMEQARYLKDSAHGDYWPVVDLVGSYNYERNYQGVEGTKKDTRVYLKMYWKYNLGNQIGDKLLSADGKFNAEKYSHQAAIKNIEKEVNQTWGKIQTHTQRNQLAKETVKIAENVYQARLEMKQKGRGSDIGLLNSKVRLLDAQIAQLNAQHEAIKSSYELAYVTGLLSPSFFNLD